MRVALSASFWRTSGKVADLLKTCDVIFTSNQNWISDIEEMFGYDKVIHLGDARPQTMANIRKLFPEGTEFITFGDLFNLDKSEDKSEN